MAARRSVGLSVRRCRRCHRCRTLSLLGEAAFVHIYRDLLPVEVGSNAVGLIVGVSMTEDVLSWKLETVKEELQPAEIVSTAVDFIKPLNAECTCSGST